VTDEGSVRPAALEHPTSEQNNIVETLLNAVNAEASESTTFMASLLAKWIMQQNCIYRQRMPRQVKKW
jgi:hypothetical protein